MLDGVVPFPPDFAARYRAKGYWQDKSLAEEFAAVFRQFADRVALIDGERALSPTPTSTGSATISRSISWSSACKPLDRVVPALPNVAEFVILYFALQKIGAHSDRGAGRRIATTRSASSCALAGAVACVYPERQSDFDFAPMVARIAQESPCMQLRDRARRRRGRASCRSPS